jgi:hypothetical protein
MQEINIANDKELEITTLTLNSNIKYRNIFYIDI